MILNRLRWDPALWPVAVSAKEAGLTSHNTTAFSGSDVDDFEEEGHKTLEGTRASMYDVAADVRL